MPNSEFITVFRADDKGLVKHIRVSRAELDKMGKTATRASASVGKSFGVMSAGAVKLARSVTGIGAGLSALAFGNMIRDSIAAGDQIQKLSIRLGATTEALSEYRHVAERTGVSFNALTTAWQRQTRRISEAAQGTGAARDALRELGVDVQALARMRPERQFEVLADAIDKVALHSDKARLAQKLWDSEGVQLLQTIEGGTRALGEMREEAIAFGRSIDRETADKMANAADEMTRFSGATEGLATELTVTLLPAITGITEALTTAVQGVSEFFDAWQTTAEWWDAYQSGTIGFTEWLGADNEEAARRLEELGAAAKETMTIVIDGGTESASALSNIGGAADKATNRVRKLSGELGDLAMEYADLSIAVDEFWRGNESALIDANSNFFRLGETIDETQSQIAESATEASSRTTEAYDRSADNIERSLTDALMRSFESGGDFADAFADSLQNLFGALVLRPLVQPIAQLAAGGVLNAASGLVGGGGGGGPGFNTSGLGLIGALSPTFAAGSAAGLGLLGAGQFAGYGGLVSGLFGAGHLGMGLGALAPVLGPLAIAAPLIAGLFEDDPHFGFQASGPLGGASFDFTEDLSDEQIAHIGGIIDTYDQALIGALDDAQLDLLQGQGLTTGHLNIEDPWAIGQAIINRYEEVFANIDETMAKAINDIARGADMSTEEALQGLEELLAAWVLITDVTARLGQTVDGAGVQAILSGAGGLDAFSSGVQVFFSTFYSEAEQFAQFEQELTAQFAELNAGALPETREGFRALVEGLDLTTDSGQQLFGALMALVPAMDAYYAAVERQASGLVSAAAQISASMQWISQNPAQGGAAGRFLLGNADIAPGLVNWLQQQTPAAGNQAVELLLSDPAGGRAAIDWITANPDIGGGVAQWLINNPNVAPAAFQVFGQSGDRAASAIRLLQQDPAALQDTLRWISEDPNRLLESFGLQVASPAVTSQGSAPSPARGGGGGSSGRSVVDPFAGLADVLSEIEGVIRDLGGTDYRQSIDMLRQAALVTLNPDVIREYYRRLIDEYDAQVSDLSGTLDELTAVTARIGDVFASLSESISRDIRGITGRDTGLLDLRKQVFGALDLTDPAAIEQRLTIADDYRSALLANDQALRESGETITSTSRVIREAGIDVGEILQYVATVRGDVFGRQALLPRRLAGARGGYFDMLAGARAGGVSAGALTAGAGEYIAAARETAGSALEYERTVGGVLADLEGVARAPGAGGTIRVVSAVRAVQATSQAVGINTIEELQALQDLVDGWNEVYQEGAAEQTDAITTEIAGLRSDSVALLGDIRSALVEFLGSGGFASGGIVSGPTSGYPVILHGTEAITPFPIVASQTAAANDVLVAEIRGLRDDLRTVGAVQVRHAEKSARMLTKWDIDGQPEVRV